jgi:glycosyltransferase involved in cell wall biosynthesis
VVSVSSLLRAIASIPGRVLGSAESRGRNTEPERSDLVYLNRLPRRFMTDIPAQRSDGTWAQHTTMIPPPAGLYRLSRRVQGTCWGRAVGAVLAIAWGLRLLRVRRRFPAAITSGAGAGVVFGMLQAVVGLGRIPHVMMDCLWYRERGLPRRLLARIKFASLARSVSCFVVWASGEVDDYAGELGVPRHKLVFVPYHHTLEGYAFTIEDGGYVFAGGDGDRDYATLVEAVRGLQVPVLIGTRLPSWHGRSDLPPNITVRSFDAAGFRQAMAGARVVVVPMQGGLLHAGGQQTYLNAMRMGKPVIVCDDRGARDYIDDGVTGLIVPPGRPQELRQAMLKLLGDGSLRAELGRRASFSIDQRRLSTEDSVRRVIGLARRLLQSPRGAGVGKVSMVSEDGPAGTIAGP